MKQILIVDDEFGIVDALSIVLEDEGYLVSTAPNGKEALARIAEKRPDLIILDVMMPVMGGRDLLQRVRSVQATRDIPIVMMSAAPQPRTVIEAERAGEISAFLHKPFDLFKLLGIVGRVIGPGEK